MTVTLTPVLFLSSIQSVLLLLLLSDSLGDASPFGRYNDNKVFKSLIYELLWLVFIDLQLQEEQLGHDGPTDRAEQPGLAFSFVDDNKNTE